MPTPPLEVGHLPGAAPPTPFERLQFLRARLYENVVAAGSGVPVDINPARVVQLLKGAEGTPFESVASAALRARWAGRHARIGCGFTGGAAPPGGPVGSRPKHGTHVAGTVGSASYGVAKNVYLRAVRVLNCAGSGTSSQVLAGMNWVTTNHISPSVANMSLGGGFSQAENDAASTMSASGVFLADR